MKKNIFILNVKSTDEITFSIKEKIDNMDIIFIQKYIDKNNIFKTSVDFDFKDYNKFKSEAIKYKNIAIIFDTYEYNDFFNSMLEDELFNVILDENNIVSVLFGKKSNYKITDSLIDSSINIDFGGINIIKNINKENIYNIKEKLLKSFSENIEI